MEKTRNNCFGSKKRGMTLRQMKTGKLECRNVTATCCCYISTLVLTCFRLTKGRAMFFRPETIVVSFLHLYGVTFQSVIKLLY